MPYKKGDVGNPNGGKSRQMFRNALALALQDGDRKRLRDIAEKLVEQAEAGDLAAIKEVADRLDGKPAQAVNVAGADGGPFKVQISKVEDGL